MQHTVAVAVVDEPRHLAGDGVGDDGDAVLGVPRLGVGDALCAGDFHPQHHIPVGVIRRAETRGGAYDGERRDTRRRRGAVRPVALHRQREVDPMRERRRQARSGPCRRTAVSVRLRRAANGARDNVPHPVVAISRLNGFIAKVLLDRASQA